MKKSNILSQIILDIPDFEGNAVIILYQNFLN